MPKGTITLFRSMARAAGLKQDITGDITIGPSLVEIITERASRNVHGYVSYDTGDLLVFPHTDIDHIHIPKENQ